MDKFLSLMDDFIEKEKRDFATNELLKIKVEIEKECHIDDYDIKIVDLNDIDKIIDNHISELKGEQE